VHVFKHDPFFRQRIQARAISSMKIKRMFFGAAFAWACIPSVISMSAARIFMAGS
jgi:hypothetical protein